MITDAILQATAEAVGRLGSGEAAVAALRAAWPGLRFAACLDDDIPPRLSPAFAGGRFNLYLIGGGEHCLALTTEAAAAIGVVVAEVLDDDV